MACGVCRYTPSPDLLESLPINAADDENYPLLDQHLHEVEAFILSQKALHRKVLVHCFAGINRSGAICAAYLMRQEGLSLMQAVRLMIEKRGFVLANSGFVYQLVVLAR